MPFVSRFAMLCLLCLAPLGALAQGAGINIGTAQVDPNQKVEVTADSLSVDQRTGQAVFSGNVLVVQGQLRLTAGQVTVIYAKSASGTANGIDSLLADGGVTFVTATDAVEATKADYTVSSGKVTLSGQVLLTQGPTAISGERLVIDLRSGTGQMEGNVRTVIAPAKGGN